MEMIHFDLQLRKEEGKEKEKENAAISSGLEKQVKKTNQQHGDSSGRKPRKTEKKNPNPNKKKAVGEDKITK